MCVVIEIIMKLGHEVIKIIDVSEEQIAFDSSQQTNQQRKIPPKLSQTTIVILVVILILCLGEYAYLDQTQQIPTERAHNETHTQQTISVQQSNASAKYVDQVSHEQSSQLRNKLQSNGQVKKQSVQQQLVANSTNQQTTQPSQAPKEQMQVSTNSSFKSFPLRAISAYAIKRKNSYQQVISALKKQDQQELHNRLKPYNITIEQFMRAIVLAQHAPLDTISSPTSPEQDILKQLDQEERTQYEKKYQISKYKQLPMCILVPTFNNYKRFRYYFNLHSILQQHYSNYRIVIVDDASPDKTGFYIQYEIKGNSQQREKIVLVKNTKRMHHMYNFYNGISQHCKKGEILVTVDGDDQLIGRYVFKVINAQYHRSKSMAIYSNHIQSKRQVVFEIGISNSYPQQVKQNNQYRQKAHLYSHLRTSWVDLFLLIKQNDLKDSSGRWFNNAVDNAMFYPIFEMSCSQVEYLSQIFYKYNTFTGQNVDNLPIWMRKQTNDDINSKQKYRCIKQWHRQTYDAIKGYLK